MTKLVENIKNYPLEVLTQSVAIILLIMNPVYNWKLINKQKMEKKISRVKIKLPSQSINLLSKLKSSTILCPTTKNEFSNIIDNKSSEIVSIFSKYVPR